MCPCDCHCDSDDAAYEDILYCFEGSIEEDPFERPYGDYDPHHEAALYDMMYGCPDNDSEYTDVFYKDDEEDPFDGCCDDRAVCFPF